jgi:hypothetical protein
MNLGGFIMIKRKLYQKLLMLGVVGSITISSAIVAFADNVKITNSSKTSIEGKLDVNHRGGDIQKGGMQKGNPLVAVLASQVTAGVITQTEADKVTEFLKTKEVANKAKRDAEKAKLEAMTAKERTAYMKANRPTSVNIFTELVTAGILTKDQADKIQAAAPQKLDKMQGQRKEKGSQGLQMGKQSGNFLGSVLTTQVTAGVITQTEADKVTEFLKTKEVAIKAERDAEKAKFEAMTDAEKKIAMETKKAERDAEKAKLQVMTNEERTAYMKANRPTSVDIFTELVTAGILTKDQADKIQAAAPQRSEKGRDYVR